MPAASSIFVPTPDGRPAAFVHVDLDAWWAIRRCYGDAHAMPAAPDPVYAEGIPALAELFDHHRIAAGFFAVGMDAAQPAQARILKHLSERHEIASHSWSHDLALGARPEATIRDEVRQSREAITSAIGKPPMGFRAPGYTWSPRLMQVLAEEGYAYDSSLLPTPAGPALRLADAWIRGGWPKSHQYGPTWRAICPRAPHIWNNGSRSRHSMAELPVLVSWPWRMPLQAGMLMLRGITAFRRSLEELSRRGIPIVFLLHGIDAVDTQRHPPPLPGKRGQALLQFPLAHKLKIIGEALEIIRTSHFPLRADVDIAQISSVRP